jgi:hypothetical protein
MVMQQVGINKMKAMAHGSDPSGHGRAKDNELAFELKDGRLQQTFNVLYVQTPKISLMEAPLFRSFVETCEEAAELVKPVLRLGIRENSLFDKCPYYE